MSVLFRNNSSATLATGINSSTTTIVVTAGQGSLFPAIAGTEYFFATLVDSSNNLEIVKVTARSGDNFTVLRGQDGTASRSFLAGDRIELRVVAAALNALVRKEGAESISGVKTFSDGIVSDVTGNVTGNVTGDTTGSHTGPVVGNVTGNVTGNLTGNVTGDTSGNAGSATILINGDWRIEVASTHLVFKYQGTVIFRMNNNGSFQAANDVAGFQSL